MQEELRGIQRSHKEQQKNSEEYKGLTKSIRRTREEYKGLTKSINLIDLAAGLSQSAARQEFGYKSWS